MAILFDRFIRPLSAAIALSAIFVSTMLSTAPSSAQAQQRAHAARRHAAPDDPQEALRRQINANTVSIISGNITGSYVRYAADIASVLDDGNNMRVLPILGAGAVQNVTDIMFLKGVDMGFVRTDSVEAIRREGKVGDIEKKVQYIAKLVDDEMHVIAPSDITDIRQLAGKKVNMDVIGSGTHFSTELIFERLGIKVEPTSYEQNVAYEKLKAGEIDASIFFGGKPVGGVAAFSDPAHRFHLVPVHYQRELEDYYLPASLSGKDYPNLLGKDEKIDTISVSTLLAVYNLRPDNERYQRVARFVDRFFSKFTDFLKPPRHPKWKDVNLAATVPGWTRFKPAQDWLDNKTSAIAPPDAARKAQASDGQEDEIAKFKRFVEQRRGKHGSNLSGDDTVRMFREYQEWSGKK